MAGFRLVIESFGEVIVDRRLLRFQGNLVAPVAALELVAVELRRAVQRQFDTEGRSASGGWPQLADSTIAQRGSAHPILRVTDALMNSLVNKYDENHTERLSHDSLTFGSTVPYGIFHQSSKPRTKIPYRPPVALNPSTKARIAKTIQEALLGQQRAADRMSESFAGLLAIGGGALT